MSIERFEQRRIKSLQNENISTFVCETGNLEIIGFAVCGPDRNNDLIYRGEIFALYVLAKYQRKGVGYKLFERCVTFLKEKGLDSLRIWVLNENKFASFYKKSGGILLEQKEIKIGEKLYLEDAYGWLHI